MWLLLLQLFTQCCCYCGSHFNSHYLLSSLPHILPQFIGGCYGTILLMKGDWTTFILYLSRSKSKPLQNYFSRSKSKLVKDKICINTKYENLLHSAQESTKFTTSTDMCCHLRFIASTGMQICFHLQFTEQGLG